MGLFSKKEKTPEEELVDYLVGSGTFGSDNVDNLSLETAERGKLRDNVKKVWMDGAKVDEIQKVYDETLANFEKFRPIREKNKALVARLVGFGGAGSCNLRDAFDDFASQDELRLIINDIWMKGGTSQEIRKAYEENGMRLKKLEKSKKKEKNNITEEELVKEIWKDIMGVLPDSFSRLRLAVIVLNAWKNGASVMNIQKVYEENLPDFMISSNEDNLEGN